MQSQLWLTIRRAGGDAGTVIDDFTWPVRPSDALRWLWSITRRRCSW
jgi:hypothetical protein